MPYPSTGFPQRFAGSKRAIRNLLPKPQIEPLIRNRLARYQHSRLDLARRLGGFRRRG
jgi:hypothetical protein